MDASNIKFKSRINNYLIAILSLVYYKIVNEHTSCEIRR